ATLAVIPRQHQRNDESQRKRERDATAQTVWPRELLRNDIHALQQRERERHVSQCPLHQLASLQALQELRHGPPPWRQSLAAARRGRLLLKHVRGRSGLSRLQAISRIPASSPAIACTRSRPPHSCGSRRADRICPTARRSRPCARTRRTRAGAARCVHADPTTARKCRFRHRWGLGLGRLHAKLVAVDRDPTDLPPPNREHPRASPPGIRPPRPRLSHALAHRHRSRPPEKPVRMQPAISSSRNYDCRACTAKSTRGLSDSRLALPQYPPLPSWRMTARFRW